MNGNQLNNNSNGYYKIQQWFFIKNHKWEVIVIYSCPYIKNSPSCKNVLLEWKSTRTTEMD